MTTDQRACVDCTYTEMHQEREDEVAESVEALGRAYRVIIDTEEETVDVFSNAPCCCCGTSPALYRYVYYRNYPLHYQYY